MLNLSNPEKSNLFNAPETYMDKLAVGRDVPNEATDLDFSIEKNIKNIAEAKNKDISQKSNKFFPQEIFPNVMTRTIRFIPKSKILCIKFFSY